MVERDLSSTVDQCGTSPHFMECKTRFPATLRMTGAYVLGAMLNLGTKTGSSIQSAVGSTALRALTASANLPHIVIDSYLVKGWPAHAMEGCTHRLLETAALRTLHAHSFSRASAVAAHVLHDLLARYLALLAASCAKYAHHAGRTSLSVHDALGALDDLGVAMDELTDFAAVEAKELSRYAVYSTRRIEDLNELSGTCLRLCHSTIF